MPDTSDMRNTVTTYTESVVLLNGADALNGSEQDAVNRALANNTAVGIIAGAYDEPMTVTMASTVFLRNLGYSVDALAPDARFSLFDFVYEDDRDFFKAPTFASFEGDFEFRAISVDGAQEYVHAYKTDSVNAQGDHQWVLSARISKDSVAMNQLMRGLNRLVVRFAVCDLESGLYDFYSCGNGDPYPEHGDYQKDLVGGMIAGLQIVSKDGSESVASVMSAENLRSHLASPDDSYGFDYASTDGSKFYRMSVIPLDFKNGKLVRFLMIGMDVTRSRTEELRSQRALADAYRAANQANEAKSAFLSNMSHDIRTPMNAIIGMTAIASAHIDDRDRVLDSLGKITTSSRHLLGLINEVLDMSRIERGKMSLNYEAFSLPELVDNMLEMVKPSVLAHNLDFDVRIQDIAHEDVVGDSLRIQQVFTNIVGNAVKYTPDGGSVKLTIAEKPTNRTNVGCYEFTVEDTGIGMDEAFLEHIFEPFVRADNAVSNGTQGSGLGMPIAKNIVNMMDGDITVASKLGEGTTVTASIFLGLQDEETSTDEQLADLPVLVVDDDVISCESTVETLISIGMQGEWVSNGPDAVRRVTKTHEDQDDFYAVILDWKMPGMDGVETARAIRGVVGPDIPIIMLTAYDFGEIEQEARAAGVNCFMTKPLFRSRLRSVFKHLVGGQTPVQQASAANELPIGDYSGKRALVVEDNLLNREIMVEILSETNMDIDTAVNGKIAVDMVAEAPEGYYDIVFMDIQMPVMNGYDATIAIRALGDGKGATLPIIALTANAFAEDVIMAKNAGVNEHLSKPVDMDKLAQAMHDWIR